MNTKKLNKGLGKGIGEIFSATANTTGGGLTEIDIDQLMPSPYQPRSQIDPSTLDELAKTIGAKGILQPILVRQVNNGYEIIAGERRWRAAHLAGLRTVPVVIRMLSDQDAMLAALIENVQRQDLHVLEQARAAKKIIVDLKQTIAETADALGMSRPALSNLIRLLDLDPFVLKLLHENKISAGHARALATLPKNKQIIASRLIIKQELNVRKTEELASKFASDDKVPEIKKEKTPLDKDMQETVNQLCEALGMSVKIQHGKNKSKGKFIIKYHDLDSFDLITKLLSSEANK